MPQSSFPVNMSLNLVLIAALVTRAAALSPASTSAVSTAIERCRVATQEGSKTFYFATNFMGVSCVPVVQPPAHGAPAHGAPNDQSFTAAHCHADSTTDAAAVHVSHAHSGCARQTAGVDTSSLPGSRMVGLSTYSSSRWCVFQSGSGVFSTFCAVSCFFSRSKRNAVRIPKASNRKLKASHRREREQAPHQQTPGANTAENGSSDGND